MISQLLATIMMALGVASGTKATSNTFYDAEKPQPKKAVIQNDYNLHYIIQDQYADSTNKLWGYKYFLSEETIPQTQTTSNLLLDPFLLSNTAYTWSEKDGSSRQSYAYQILKFTNYTNSLQTINIETNVMYDNTNARTYVRRYVYQTTDDNANTLIDKTLNTSTKNQIETELNNLQKETLVNTEWWQTTTTNMDINIGTPQIELAENETKFIILKIHLSKYNDDDMGWMLFDDISINGQYLEKQITQEIVDIPGIMFTILGMPFSFISTAFNLTIFPNTPYQINFANLFMVILSAFILMWLIKKVFH